MPIPYCQLLTLISCIIVIQRAHIFTVTNTIWRCLGAYLRQRYMDFSKFEQK